MTWQGLYGGEPQDSTTLRQLGTDVVQETASAGYGAVAGEQFDKAFTSLELARANAEIGINPATGMPFDERPGSNAPVSFAMVPPDQLNERYGIKGRLSFTAPLPESVAEEMNARTHEKILREDIISRSSAGPVGRFVAGLVGGLPGIVDPINIASAFVPAVPEARAALWAARAGEGAFAQAGVRAGVGALQGIAGQTALTPLYYGLARHDQEDYGATDALLNIALGGVFGGGLHAVLGRAPSPETTRMALTIERQAPETKEALLRGAVADMAAGEPVETPSYIIETPGGARPYEAVPKEPERLASFLQRQGGVRDEGGDVAALLGAGTTRPGLRNTGGLSLDEAALRAWQDGFLPGEERPDINTLLEALDRDLRGRPVYREQDEFAAAEHRDAMERNSEIDRLAAEHDIAVSGKTQEQFYQAVRDKLGADAAASEAERLATGAENIMARADAEGWIPDFGPGSPTTPEEIEHAYRQESAARAADAGAQRLGEPGPLGTAARPDEAGARPGGRGVGAGQRGQPIEPELPRELIADEAKAPLDRLNDEIATLEKELAPTEGERPAELDAADRLVADAEAEARAIEQGGVCLGRRL